MDPGETGVRPSPTVMVTGATDGLGRTIVRSLADKGAHVILHGRDPPKLQLVAAELERDGFKQPKVLLADLADLHQVRLMARQLSTDQDHLDVMVNNAGLGSGVPDGRTRRTSADGFDLRLAVNYLTGFRLTLELPPLLQAAAPARIVNVASIGQHPIEFENLVLERANSGGRAYGQSKLAQIMFSFELAEQLPASQVTVNSLHPGTYMPTKMVLEEIGYTIDSLDDGVDATARLVSAPELGGVTGEFFNRTQRARVNNQAYDRSARQQLSERSLELVGHRGFGQGAGYLPRLPSPDLLVVLDRGEWLVEVVQERLPLLISLGSPEPLDMVLQSLPLHQEQVALWLLEAAAQAQPAESGHR